MHGYSGHSSLTHVVRAGKGKAAIASAAQPALANGSAHGHAAATAAQRSDAVDGAAGRASGPDANGDAAELADSTRASAGGVCEAPHRSPRGAPAADGEAPSSVGGGKQRRSPEGGRHRAGARERSPSDGARDAGNPAEIDPGSDPGCQGPAQRDGAAASPPPEQLANASQGANPSPSSMPAAGGAPSSASGTPTAAGSAAGGDDDLNPNPTGADAGAAAPLGELRRDWDALLAEAAGCRDAARQGELMGAVRAMAERCAAAGISVKYGKKARAPLVLELQSADRLLVNMQDAAV